MYHGYDPWFEYPNRIHRRCWYFLTRVGAHSQGPAIRSVSQLSVEVGNEVQTIYLASPLPTAQSPPFHPQSDSHCEKWPRGRGSAPAARFSRLRSTRQGRAFHKQQVSTQRPPKEIQKSAGRVPSWVEADMAHRSAHLPPCVRGATQKWVPKPGTGRESPQRRAHPSCERGRGRDGCATATTQCSMAKMQKPAWNRRLAQESSGLPTD